MVKALGFAFAAFLGWMMGNAAFDNSNQLFQGSPDFTTIIGLIILMFLGGYVISSWFRGEFPGMKHLGQLAVVAIVLFASQYVLHIFPIWILLVVLALIVGVRFSRRGNRKETPELDA